MPLYLPMRNRDELDTAAEMVRMLPNIAGLHPMRTRPVKPCPMCGELTCGCRL